MQCLLAHRYNDTTVHYRSPLSEGAFMGNVLRLPLCLIGGGFIWARGSLLFFLNKSVVVSSLGAVSDLFQMTAVILASAIVFTGGKHLSRNRSIISMALVGCVASILSTPCIMGTIPCMIDLFIINLIGQVLDGLGQSLMWIAWGLTLTRFDFETVETTLLSWMPVSVVLMLTASFFTALNVFSTALLVGFFMVLPIISTAAMKATLLISDEPQARKLKSPELLAPFQSNNNNLTSSNSLTVDFIHLGCAFFIVSLGWNAFLAYNATSFEIVSLLFALGAGTSFIVIWFALKTTPHFGLSTIYRWVMPVFVLGVTLNQISGHACVIMASLCLTVVNMVFETMTKLFTIYAVKRTETNAVKIIAVGFSVAAIGGVAGTGAWMTAQAIGGEKIAGIILLITMCVFVFLASAVLERETPSMVKKSFFNERGIPKSQQNEGLRHHSDPENPPSKESTLESNNLTSRCKSLADQYGLTEREQDVLYLLAQGRSRTYIRETLYISKGTVDSHIHHIYSKIGINSKDTLINMLLDNVKK